MPAPTPPGYTPQEWKDLNPSYVLSALRMKHIEAGLTAQEAYTVAVQQYLEEQLATAGSSVSKIKSLGEVEGSVTPNLAEGNVFLLTIKGETKIEKPTHWPVGFTDAFFIVKQILGRKVNFGPGITLIGASISTEPNAVSVFHVTSPDAGTTVYAVNASEGREGKEGKQGPQGERGERGFSGATGERGVEGKEGKEGKQGSKGENSTIPGPQGPKGETGPVGATGAKGADSTVPGPTGPAGAQGPVGETGLGFNWRGEWVNTSTYALNDTVYLHGNSYESLKSGNKNHEPPIDNSNEWWSLSVLHGAAGVEGKEGKAGAPGPTGPTGATGPTGGAGATGAAGATGPRGLSILHGTAVPTPELGNNEEFYLNTATHEIFGPKTEGTWGGGTSIIGPTGPTGIQGERGEPGPQGPTGEPGIGGGGPQGYIDLAGFKNLKGESKSIKVFQGGESESGTIYEGFGKENQKVIKEALEVAQFVAKGKSYAGGINSIISCSKPGVIYLEGYETPPWKIAPFGKASKPPIPGKYTINIPAGVAMIGQGPKFNQLTLTKEAGRERERECARFKAYEETKLEECITKNEKWPTTPAVNLEPSLGIVSVEDSAHGAMCFANWSLSNQNGISEAYREWHEPPPLPDGLVHNGGGSTANVICDLNLRFGFIVAGEHSAHYNWAGTPWAKQAYLNSFTPTGNVEFWNWEYSGGFCLAYCEENGPSGEQFVGGWAGTGTNGPQFLKGITPQGKLRQKEIAKQWKEKEEGFRTKAVEPEAKEENEGKFVNCHMMGIQFEGGGRGLAYSVPFNGSVKLRWTGNSMPAASSDSPMSKVGKSPTGIAPIAFIYAGSVGGCTIPGPGKDIMIAQAGWGDPKAAGILVSGSCSNNNFGDIGGVVEQCRSRGIPFARIYNPLTRLEEPGGFNGANVGYIGPTTVELRVNTTKEPIAHRQLVQKVGVPGVETTTPGLQCGPYNKVGGVLAGIAMTGAKPGEVCVVANLADSTGAGSIEGLALTGLGHGQGIESQSIKALSTREGISTITETINCGSGSNPTPELIYGVKPSEGAALISGFGNFPSSGVASVTGRVFEYKEPLVAGNTVTVTREAGFEQSEFEPAAETPEGSNKFHLISGIVKGFREGRYMTFRSVSPGVTRPVAGVPYYIKSNSGNEFEVSETPTSAAITVTGGKLLAASTKFAPSLWGGSWQSTITYTEKTIVDYEGGLWEAKNIGGNLNKKPGTPESVEFWKVVTPVGGKFTTIPLKGKITGLAPNVALSGKYIQPGSRVLFANESVLVLTGELPKEVPLTIKATAPTNMWGSILLDNTTRIASFSNKKITEYPPIFLANTTLGSEIIEAKLANSIVGIAPGQTLIGNGIPAGTTVTSISGLKITMNNAATATYTGFVNTITALSSTATITVENGNGWPAAGTFNITNVGDYGSNGAQFIFRSRSGNELKECSYSSSSGGLNKELLKGVTCVLPGVKTIVGKVPISKALKLNPTGILSTTLAEVNTNKNEETKTYEGYKLASTTSFESKGRAAIELSTTLAEPISLHHSLEWVNPFYNASIIKLSKQGGIPLTRRTGATFAGEVTIGFAKMNYFEAWAYAGEYNVGTNYAPGQLVYNSAKTKTYVSINQLGKENKGVALTEVTKWKDVTAILPYPFLAENSVGVTFLYKISLSVANRYSEPPVGSEVKFTKPRTLEYGEIGFIAQELKLISYPEVPPYNIGAGAVIRQITLTPTGGVFRRTTAPEIEMGYESLAEVKGFVYATSVALPTAVTWEAGATYAENAFATNGAKTYRSKVSANKAVLSETAAWEETNTGSGYLLSGKVRDLPALQVEGSAYPLGPAAAIMVNPTGNKGLPAYSTFYYVKWIPLTGFSPIEASAEEEEEAEEKEEEISEGEGSAVIGGFFVEPKLYIEEIEGRSNPIVGCSYMFENITGIKTITSLKISSVAGWPSKGEIITGAPSGGKENIWVAKYTSLNGEGTWSAATSYVTGNIVIEKENGKYYKAKENNINKKPAENPAVWELTGYAELLGLSGWASLSGGTLEIFAPKTPVALRPGSVIPGESEVNVGFTATTNSLGRVGAITTGGTGRLIGYSIEPDRGSIVNFEPS